MTTAQTTPVVGRVGAPRTGRPVAPRQPQQHG